ncbi:class I SAM-dependent methyltransferase [Nocardioides cynanchi]|uniref:class I SAM-dependent methyltransferase n=1 Tax=Nocardioides cynanchi TaxID=2558918 RepID=UPI001245205A|nr:class I SAM-dependent methyltransferase [Nocardioides cynanchi]
MERVTSKEGLLEPDTKDWTWVLGRRCEECGLDVSTVERHDLPHAFRANAQVWLALLADPSAAERTLPHRWSTLEYACHVHDVHQIFHDRVSSMLVEDTPHFANWDQDETALEKRYASQMPSIIGPTLVAAAYAVGDLYASVPPLSWHRRGLRSDGSEFTVESLGRYHLHDVVHHLHDVRAAARAATVRAYDAFAADYRAGTPDLPVPVATAVSRFAAVLPPGARVLEIGSGPGRDARALEEAGLSVRRTDVTPAFVDLLRRSGHDADVVDPLTDDLSDPAVPGTPYDAVWAGACLLHVDRDDLTTVLGRLAGATRAGGLLYASLKEGDGESWSVHGSIAAPRFFTYWQEGPLREAVSAAGWSVEHIGHGDGLRGERWLEVLATRQ